MKIKLLLLSVILPLFAASQTTNTTNTVFSNGFGATKFLNVPYGTTPNIAGLLPGSLYFNTSVNKPVYYNGSVWQYYLSEQLASTLYKPINGTTDWVDINGKPTFFSGSYLDLTSKPDLSVYYLASNPSGFATKTQNDGLYQAIGNYLTQSTGDARYVLLSGSYANPVWIASLPYSKITGTPTIPTNNNQLTNGAGYITSYTETDPVFNAQKSNYYLASNPSGYISSYTETDPIWQSVSANYRTKNQNDILYQAAGNYYLSSNPAGYISSFTEVDPQFNAQKGNYYLSSNPSGYISSVDSTQFRTVSNSLSKAQVQTALNSKEPTVTPGTTSQYYRGDKTFQTLSTSVVPEGSNLYYTDSRVAANPVVSGKQNQLNGSGFVKSSGTTISYDSTSYYKSSNPNGYTSNVGTLTSFGKVDGFGITSTVTNSTSTPVHTIAADTTKLRTTANSFSTSQTVSLISSYIILPTKTASYTVLLSDFGTSAQLIIPVNATSGNVVITLPPITNMAGKIVNIKRLDGSSNTLTISGNGSNIDGSATLNVVMQWGNAAIIASTQYLTL